MNTKITFLALVVTITRTFGGDSSYDIANFRNETIRRVIVYIADGSNHYYTIFPLNPGGTDNVGVQDKAIVTVTVAPPPEQEGYSMAPEGKQIARTKLFIPTRGRLEKGERNLFYRISDGKIRFIAAGRARKWP